MFVVWDHVSQRLRSTATPGNRSLALSGYLGLATVPSVFQSGNLAQLKSAPSSGWQAEFTEAVEA